MSILRRIVKAKKAEVKIAKVKAPVEELLKIITKSPANRNFRDVFENNDLSIVGEIKKKAPSAGVIKASIKIDKIVKAYEKSGIKALSIVTDKKFFDGKLEYIKEAKKYCSLPVLRKDFIIDEYQIYESRCAGADAVLFIASILEKRVLNAFVKKARMLNMTPVVEVHTKDEVKRAVSSGADVIGINTRDLKTFKINLSKIKQLVKYVPKDKFVICESGIKSVEDVAQVLIDARVKGLLIGTMLMKMKPENIRDFVNEAVRFVPAE